MFQIVRPSVVQYAPILRVCFDVCEDLAGLLNKSNKIGVVECARFSGFKQVEDSAQNKIHWVRMSWTHPKKNWHVFVCLGDLLQIQMNFADFPKEMGSWAGLLLELPVFTLPQIANRENLFSVQFIWGMLKHEQKNTRKKQKHTRKKSEKTIKTDEKYQKETDNYQKK